MAIIIDKKAAKSVVVQNDAATDVAKKKVEAVSPSSLLDALEGKRIAWEQGAYRTSNQQLYAVLAECYLYGGETSTEQARLRSKALEEFCKLRGYAVKKDSPLMTRIVKAVFGNVDRRRISTYSLVLRSAKAANVLPTKLAEWIEERGGIQEIKLARSATYVSPKQKAETAAKVLTASTALAVVKTEALTLLADGDYVGEECVLVAEQQADGSFAIKALTRNGTALTAALGAVYSERKKAAQAQKSEREAANDADMTNAAIEAATRVALDAQQKDAA